jgi:hypothetical protein
VLRSAIDEELTPRQREVFVAVSLNEVPIDVVALELRSTRNAVYKTSSIPGADCAPVWRRRATVIWRGGQKMTDLRAFDELPRAEPGYAGCDAGTPIIDQYVEIELRGEDPSEAFR